MSSQDFTDRTLRAITVYNFIFVCSFMIPYGAASHNALLPLTTLPAAFSMIIGLIALGGGMKYKAVAIPFDAILLAAYIGMAVPSLVAIRNQYSVHLAMIGTYGTVPLLLNLCIHAYCIVRHLPLPGIGATTTCPNCQHEHHVVPFRFPPRSTLFPGSTIFTPDEDIQSEAPLVRDFEDSTTIRASSEFDGNFVDAGPPATGDHKQDTRLV